MFIQLYTMINVFRTFVDLNMHGSKMPRTLVLWVQYFMYNFDFVISILMLVLILIFIKPRISMCFCITCSIFLTALLGTELSWCILGPGRPQNSFILLIWFPGFSMANSIELKNKNN